MLARALLIHALRIQEYVKNGRTAIVFRRHETLLRKELDGTDREATNELVQVSLDQLLPKLTATLIMNFEEVSCKRPDKPFCYTRLINFFMCDLLLE